MKKRFGLSFIVKSLILLVVLVAIYLPLIMIEGR